MVGFSIAEGSAWVEAREAYRAAVVGLYRMDGLSQAEVGGSGGPFAVVDIGSVSAVGASGGNLPGGPAECPPGERP